MEEEKEEKWKGMKWKGEMEGIGGGERRRAKRCGEEETVLPLMSSLSRRRDRLLATKVWAQFRSQLDLNLSLSGKDFQVSEKCPLGCCQGWVRSCLVPGGSGQQALSVP